MSSLIEKADPEVEKDNEGEEDDNGPAPVSPERMDNIINESF
jgi:hypothetical protein